MEIYYSPELINKKDQEMIKSIYYGANTWLIELNGIKILIDPWIKGSLVFSPGAWFLKGERMDKVPIINDIDLILLTQGLPDHTHLESLKLLPKNTKVVCPKTSEKTLAKAGFHDINILYPRESIKINNLLIIASEGASVPNIENGYLLKDQFNSIYIEPHGFLDENIPPQSIDAIITPTVDIEIPMLGRFIQGNKVIPDLIKLFNPKVILASTTGGDIKFTGLISSIIRQKGSIKDIEDKLPINVELIDPIIGFEYKIGV